MNETWLAHHGIPGMKWGVRRYQNKDGSLTEAGKKRYLNPDGSLKPNKVINARDYSVNQALTKAKRQTGKKYDLTDEQKKYMDESGNLTLEGGRKTLPLGQDITKYKEASKERSEWSAAWKKYFKDRSDESYKDFLKKQDILFSKINEIDMENGRNWILNNVVSTQKMKKPAGTMIDGPTKIKQPKGAISMK